MPLNCPALKTQDEVTSWTLSIRGKQEAKPFLALREIRLWGAPEGPLRGQQHLTTPCKCVSMLPVGLFPARRGAATMDNQAKAILQGTKTKECGPGELTAPGRSSLTET